MRDDSMRRRMDKRGVEAKLILIVLATMLLLLFFIMLSGKMLGGIREIFDKIFGF